METRDYLKGIITGMFLTLAGVLLGIVIYRKLNPEHYVVSDPACESRLETLEDLIDLYYLNEKDEESLADGLYHGLIYGLGDPYSRYYSPKEYEQEMTSTDGSYVGIGVVMSTMEDGSIVILEVYEGSPGEEAGLLPGDILLEADGQDASGMGLSELVAYIKSGDHSEVTFLIDREGEENQTITVPVRDVELPSVESALLEDRTGFIAISEFKGVTAEQFRQAYEELEAQDMKRLVVDLRDNPGGYVNTVCDILRMILPEGLIVYTEDKYGERDEELCSGDTPIDIPMAVLVNGESASASEIFAGAVQDHGVGIIVGETTYGKGVVQSIRSFQDGSAVKLTTSHYYTPNGNDIHEVGIRPDIEVIDDGSSEEDPVLQAAIEALRKE